MYLFKGLSVLFVVDIDSHLVDVVGVVDGLVVVLRVEVRSVQLLSLAHLHGQHFLLSSVGIL